MLQKRKNDAIVAHFERLFYQTVEQFTDADLPKWLEKHTTLNLRPYSFKNHEYQIQILSDTAREKAIQKPSQVGMSEATARKAVALMGVMEHYTLMYTLPTSSFAKRFMSTRIDPIIAESPTLTDLVGKENNNTEIKNIGTNYLYMSGCQSNNAPISVPANHIVHDEVDFSDPEVMSKYTSRLTHRPHKRRDYFSTPTAPNYGIHAYMLDSIRHYYMVKCNHCNHWFHPDFYKHGVVPSFSGHISELNRKNLRGLDLSGAKLLCPSCGKMPSLQVENRLWVAENQDGSFDRHGYQVTPFDLPNIHKDGNPMPYLVGLIGSYSRLADFKNFALGLEALDSSTGLGAEDIEGMLRDGKEYVGGLGSYVMGIDCGMVSNVLIGKVVDGCLIIVHAERVMDAGSLKRRILELYRQWRVRAAVMDSLPYTTTLMELQEELPNLYGAWYEDKDDVLETYRLKVRDEDKDKGTEHIREININRSRTFDYVMEEVRSGEIVKLRCNEDTLFSEQLQSMRRVRKSPDEEGMIWRKGDGNDHYHHTLVYLRTAVRLMGVGAKPALPGRPIRTLPLKMKGF